MGHQSSKAWYTSWKTKMTIAGKTTMNKSMYLLSKMLIFPLKIPSRELTYPPKKMAFWVGDFPFPFRWDTWPFPGGKYLLVDFWFRNVQVTRKTSKASLQSMPAVVAFRQRGQRPAKNPMMRLEDYPPGNGHVSHRKGKGKSPTQNAIFWGDMLVPWRVCDFPFENASFWVCMFNFSGGVVSGLVF